MSAQDDAPVDAEGCKDSPLGTAWREATSLLVIAGQTKPVEENATEDGSTEEPPYGAGEDFLMQT
jgi:hypothetical protein